jgi:mannose-6-phosphate isomerase class I
MDFAPAVYICVDGRGEIKGKNYTREIKKGDYFFLPYSSKNIFSVSSNNCVLIECKPSKQ